MIVNKAVLTEDGLSRVGDWSIAVQADNITLPPHMVYLWSDGNTRLPAATMSAGASALIGRSGSWVVNTHEPIHVISNSDLTRSREIVDFLQTGVKPTAD